MIKMKKLAAFAAAAVMAVSAMAVSVSASYHSVTCDTSCGTYEGRTTIGPYGTGKEVTAETEFPYFVDAPMVSVEMTIRATNGALKYHDKSSVAHTWYAGLIARSGSSDPIYVDSIYEVLDSAGDYKTEYTYGLAG